MQWTPGMKSSVEWSVPVHPWRRGRGEGYSVLRILTVGDDRTQKTPWTKKLTPNKSHGEFSILVLYLVTLFAELRSRNTRALSRIFSFFLIPQKSLLKSSHSKTNTCQIFPSKTPTNPSIIPVTWNPEYPPPPPLPPPPLGMYMWQFWTAKNIFSLNQQEQRLNKTDKEVVDSSYDAELFVRWES